MLSGTRSCAEISGIGKADAPSTSYQLGRQMLQGRKYGEGGSWGVRGLVKFHCNCLFSVFTSIASQTDLCSRGTWGEVRYIIRSHREQVYETITPGAFPPIPTG